MYLVDGDNSLAKYTKLSNRRRNNSRRKRMPPAIAGGEGEALNPMPGPKYVRVPARRNKNTSGPGALLGRQEKPPNLSGAASELCTTDMEQGGLASPPDCRLRKTQWCRSPER